MARRRRTSRRGLAASQRRKRVWADQLIAYSGVTTVQATDLLADFRGTAGSATVGLTVMAINCTQNGAVGAGTGTEGTSWHLGLYVDSVNAAVAELATPVDDPYEDWMWDARYYTARAADSGWAYDDYSRYQVRSRRKIDELEQTLWLVASPVLGTATNLDYAAHYRILIALP